MAEAERGETRRVKTDDENFRDRTMERSKGENGKTGKRGKSTKITSTCHMAEFMPTRPERTDEGIRGAEVSFSYCRCGGGGGCGGGGAGVLCPTLSTRLPIMFVLFYDTQMRELAVGVLMGRFCGHL